MREGAFWLRQGGSPYASDSFHQPPLLLYAIAPVLGDEARSLLLMRVVATLCDVCVAVMLARLSRSSGSSKSSRSHQSSGAAHDRSVLVAAAYLLNPCSILSCGAACTTPLASATKVALLLAASRRRSVEAGIAGAVALYFDPYTAMVLPALVLELRRSVGSSSRGSGGGAVRFAAAALATAAALLATSAWLLGGEWRALARHAFVEPHGALLTRDLRPTVGTGWYFLAEAFERHRAYFGFVVAVHPLLYVLPLTVALAQCGAQFTAMTLLYVAALFRGFPALGDVSLPVALAAVHWHAVAPRVRPRVLPAAVGATLASCMMPIMWHLWRERTSGNANFFFFQSAIYTMAHGIVLVELLHGAFATERAAVVRAATRAVSVAASAAAAGAAGAAAAAARLAA